MECARQVHVEGLRARVRPAHRHAEGHVVGLAEERPLPARLLAVDL
jgi:hypothetical protein